MLTNTEVNEATTNEATPCTHDAAAPVIQPLVTHEGRVRLPIPRHVNRQKLKDVTEQINMNLEGRHCEDITELNNIMYEAAREVLRAVDINVEPVEHRPMTVPPWERRLLVKIDRTRADLSKLVAGSRKRNLVQRLRIGPGKTVEAAIEELKQRTTALAGRLQRYKARVQQFKDNRDFKCNQGAFYRRLEKASAPVSPTSEQIRFWENIWSNPGPKAPVMTNQSTTQEPEKTLTNTKMQEALKKMKNWKAPGPDQLHGYWLKRFTSLHPALLRCLSSCLEKGCPEWLTTGRTVLLPKSKPGDTRPITCLNTTWKLLTSMIAEEITGHVTNNKLVEIEQKGCKRKSRGCKDQLLIDQAVIDNCRRRKTNLSVGWIDFKKAYDSISHSWILGALESLGVSKTWTKFLEREMQNWRTQIGDTTVRFKRGLFQGDSLAPLLFVCSLCPISQMLKTLNLGYSMGKGKQVVTHLWYMDDCKVYAKSAKDLDTIVDQLQQYALQSGLEFGMNKCATLQLKRGKEVKEPEEILIPNLADDNYRYLGMVQRDRIDKDAAKSELRKTYLQRVRKILKTKLNAGNLVAAVNTWAVPVLRYSGGIVKWAKNELEALDRKTRKLLAAERAMNLNSDVDRLYLPRKQGGRGLKQVEDTIRSEECSLADHYKSKARAGTIDEIAKEQLGNIRETKKGYKSRRKKERQERLHAKALHGKWFRETAEVTDHTMSHHWLVAGTLKRETEALIASAQEQALRTNAVKCRIDHTSSDPICRVCKTSDETVDHLVSSCSKMAQREYKRRHDRVGTLVHWELARKYHLEVPTKWYLHKPTATMENEEVKLLWDVNIQTDNTISARRPDIILVEKKSKKCLIIDIAVPVDKNVTVKENEKIDKYDDLKWELTRLWHLKKVEIVPIVIGALGAMSKHANSHWMKLQLENGSSWKEAQKTTLLGTARILRRVLSLPGGGPQPEA